MRALFEDYRREMERVGTSEDQVNRILAAVERKPMGNAKRSPWRTVLLAAGLCAAFAVTALALSPSLQDALEQFLGGIFPYTQEVAGNTSVDQGIEMKVVRAIADDYQAKVYVEVKDATGGHMFSEHMNMDAYVSRNQAQQPNEMRVSGFSNRLLRFDADTNTLLYEFTCQRLDRGGEEFVLYVGSIQPEYYRIESTTPLPAHRISKENLKTRTVEDGLVLEPGQTAEELENAGGISLSSLGFASDGYLHVLLQLPAETAPEDTVLCTTVRSKTSDDYMKYNVEFLDQRVFTLDGVTYMDFGIAGAMPEDIDDLELDPIYGVLVKAEPVEGKWRIPFTMEQIPTRKVAVSDSLGRENLELRLVSISPLGIWIEGATWENNRSTLNRQVMVFYFKDGSVVNLGDRTSGAAWSASKDWDGKGMFTTAWNSTEPIDPEEVIAVSIGQRYLPLDGGEASWLEKLPE